MKYLPKLLKKTTTLDRLLLSSLLRREKPMPKTKPAAVLLAFALLGNAADNITIQRDEPLQTTWFVPHKITETKGRGLLASRWKVFPSTGQTFSQDKNGSP